MTVGIFLPAFSFTMIGHEFFEALVDNKYIEPFLDGVGAAVIGLLALTAFQFVKSVIETGMDSVLFLLAFASLFHFTDKFTQPLVLVVAAIAGQVVY
jgi:chromate transporter